MKSISKNNGFQIKLEHIKLDLNTYKILLHFQNRKDPLVIHFDKPARKFYFSLIALIITEMKNLDKPEFIYIRKYEKTLKLLDNSLAGPNASKTVEGMWDKIRKAWRYTLPDLETGTLFKILDRNLIPPYEKGGKYRYDCSDEECDTWSNLFDYDENNPWRFKFAIDSVPLNLNDISVTLGSLKDNTAWQEFVKRLKMQPKDVSREKRALPIWWKKAAFALVAVLIVGVVTGIIWNAYMPPVSPTTKIDLFDKPSIAVLPFVNMSDDQKQEYFSDGITDDLITSLSKISGLFVIARNSTFTYKGKSLKVQQIAKELGVRYILEGSVRKEADQVRINAQLIDPTTGHHLWAERFDGELGNIFALQDKFTNKIVAALAVKLTAGEQELITQRGTTNVEAYDAYLQGWEVLHRGTREVLPEAVRLFKIAVELDPNYSRAHAALSRAYTSAIDRGVDRELGWTDARSLRDKHLEMAMKDPSPYTCCAVAQARIYERKYEEALAAAERAVALSPNDTDSHYSIARVLIYIGRPAEGLEFLHKAMRHNPHYPAYYLWFVGLAQFSLGQYEKAVDTYERLYKRNPKASVWIPAAAHAHLGRQQEAANMITKYLHMRGNKGPGVPAENMLTYFVFKNPKDADRFVGGLLKAGLPRPWNPVYRRIYDEAITKAEQAIGLNPNDAEAQFTMGETLIYAGKLAEAMRFFKKAIELNPEYPPYFLWYLGLAQFCLEQYEDALTSLEAYYRRKHRHPVEIVPKWLLAATYAQLGRQKEAQETLTKFMKASGYYKEYNIEKVLKDNLYTFKNQGYRDRIAEGLRKAGLK